MPNIKPVGLAQKDLVDALYMTVSSIKGICAKLDLDATVTGVDYEDNCYTNIFTVSITDSGNNVTGNTGSEVHFITPTGIDNNSLNALIYQIFDSFETLTEQLDADAGVGNGSGTYEALCYTALFLYNVTNQAQSKLGNGVTAYFTPICTLNHPDLVDLLYTFFNAIETLTEQLDADAAVGNGAGTYEALWFTAIMLLQIQNGAGSSIGVQR